MIRQEEGAAIRQENRADDNPARSRQPRWILPDPRDEDEFSTPGRMLAAALTGAVILFSLMWLAAAY